MTAPLSSTPPNSANAPAVLTHHETKTHQANGRASRMAANVRAIFTYVGQALACKLRQARDGVREGIARMSQAVKSVFGGTTSSKENPQSPSSASSPMRPTEANPEVPLRPVRPVPPPPRFAGDNLGRTGRVRHQPVPVAIPVVPSPSPPLGVTEANASHLTRQSQAEVSLKSALRGATLDLKLSNAIST